jgi:hypothetical protein
MYGPYPIKRMKGHSYELELPAQMRMYNVFHADRLRKASEALPGQVEPEQPPVDVNGHPEWPVQEILDSRIYRKRLQYRAAWLAHDPDPTWYNASSFINAPYKVRDYHEAYPEKPGPPVRLSTWIRAYEADWELGGLPEDDYAVEKETHQARPRRRRN